MLFTTCLPVTKYPNYDILTDASFELPTAMNFQVVDFSITSQKTLSKFTVLSLFRSTQLNSSSYIFSLFKKLQLDI